MYQALKQVWAGKQTFAAIDTVLLKEKKNYPYNYRPIRFIDNHDENSWDNIPAVKFKTTDGAKAAFVVMATLPGVPLLYNGQEVGYDTQINLFEKYTINWSANSELRKFYKDILQLYHHSEILKSGSVQRIVAASDKVLMFTRTLNDSMIVVMVNTANEPATVAMPEALMSRNYNDMLTNEEAHFSYDLSFKPYEFRILRALSAE